MKTARRENRKDWAEVFSNPRHGAAGQNRTCSNTWGWKQEKLQRWERCFLLTSSSIERFYYGVNFECAVGPGWRERRYTFGALSVAHKNVGGQFKAVAQFSY